MANTETLMVKITADAKDFSSKLSQVQNEVNNTSKQFDGLSKLGEGFKSVGTKLTAGVTLPIVGIGTAAAKTTVNFDNSMNKVSAVSGATGKDLDKLRNLAKEMGSSTSFSATEAADALSYMGMAGWDTQSMMDGLPGVLDLAAAGGTDLATTSDIVTDGLTSLGLSASDTNKFVDVMAATCSNSNTNIEMMGETLKYVGPVAGSLGIDMNDLSVGIGLMANAGIKGSQAGTALRSGLTNLISPSKEASAAMEKYGIEIVKNKDGSVDFAGTMQNLRDRLGGLDKTQQAAALSAIFGKEAMSGWAAIVNASDSDFSNLTNSINNSDGAAKTMADTMLNGAGGAITKMKSALEGVAITIGEKLTPYIEKAADWISKLCEKFQALSPAQQDFIVKIGLIAAAMGPLSSLAGNVLQSFGKLPEMFSKVKKAAGLVSSAFTFICSPAGLVVVGITAIIAVGVLLYKNWDKIKETAQKVWNNVVQSWNKLKSDTTNKFNEMKTNATNKFNEMKTNVTNKANEIKTNATNKFKELKTGITNKVNEAKTSVTNKFNEMKTKVTSKVSEIKTNTTNKFGELKTGMTNKISEAKTAIEGKFSSMKDTLGNKCSNIVSVCKFKLGQAKAGWAAVIQVALNAIKSKLTSFKPSWSIPKPKLPKISISKGSKSVAGVEIPYPKFNVSWNWRGGIFRRPTVLPGGIGVGDAHGGIGSNAEAVLPLNKLPELLGLDKNGNNGINITIENFTNNTDTDIDVIAEQLATKIRRQRIF